MLRNFFFVSSSDTSWIAATFSGSSRLIPEPIISPQNLMVCWPKRHFLRFSVMLSLLIVFFRNSTMCDKWNREVLEWTAESSTYESANSFNVRKILCIARIKVFPAFRIPKGVRLYSYNCPMQTNAVNHLSCSHASLVISGSAIESWDVTFSPYTLNNVLNFRNGKSVSDCELIDIPVKGERRPYFANFVKERKQETSAFQFPTSR